MAHLSCSVRWVRGLANRKRPTLGIAPSVATRSPCAYGRIERPSEAISAGPCAEVQLGPSTYLSRFGRGLTVPFFFGVEFCESARSSHFERSSGLRSYLDGYLSSHVSVFIGLSEVVLAISPPKRLLSYPKLRHKSNRNSKKSSLTSGPRLRFCRGNRKYPPPI